MLNIGEISCVHGYDGAVVLRASLTLKRVPKFFFINIDEMFIPYKVNSYQTKGSNFIIFFEDISDRNEASEIIKRKVFIEEDNMEEFVDVIDVKIKDFTLQDKKLGVIGTVVDVESYPAHDCIVCKKDIDGKIFLIPYVNDIVLKIDEMNRIVVTNLPKGLV